MTTPSEGPERPDPIRVKMEVLGLDTPEKQAAFAELLELHRTMAARETVLAQRTPRARAGQVARYGAVAGIAAMTEPGQAAVGAVGDAGQWAGGQLAEAGRDIGGAAADGYQASVDGLQSAGEAIGRQWDSSVEELNRQGEAAREAIIDGAEAAGRGIADGAGWVGEQATEAGRDIGHAATEGYQDTVEGAQSAWNGVSGWAVETWGSVSESVTQAAHSVGAWGAQQIDAVAANPTSHALVAAAAAGAVVAATPQLREAVGRGANEVSRWGKAGFSAAARLAQGTVALGKSAAEGAKNLMNEVRSDPRVQFVMAKAGWGPRETHKAVSEVTATGGENTTLPTTPDLTKALGQDGAQPAAGTKVERKATEAAAAGHGEAANTQQAGKKTEGPGQGR